jgi:hypothetical protein
MFASRRHAVIYLLGGLDLAAISARDVSLSSASKIAWSSPYAKMLQNSVKAWRTAGRLLTMRSGLSRTCGDTEPSTWSVKPAEHDASTRIMASRSILVLDAIA